MTMVQRQRQQRQLSRREKEEVNPAVTALQQSHWKRASISWVAAKKSWQPVECACHAAMRR